MLFKNIYDVIIFVDCFRDKYNFVFLIDFIHRNQMSQVV